MTNTVNRTTNHAWNAVVEWSTDNRNWLPDTSPWAKLISSDVVADGQVIQTEYTTKANFQGPFMRIRLLTANSTGTARESATVSLWLYFSFET